MGLIEAARDDDDDASGVVEAPAPAPAAAEVAPEPTYGIDEIDRLLGNLRTATSAEQFPYSDPLQFAALTHLWRAWPMLPSEVRDTAWQLFQGKLPRVEQSASPRMCFDELLRLPREEDIRRALLVRARLYDDYASEPSDSLYPTQGWVGAYLAFAKHNQVPLPFHFWSAMTALGAACRRNIYVEHGITRIYMNQYVILTGNKATGKSIAMETAIDVLRRANKFLGESTEQAPYRVNILPEDITQEGFIAKMSGLNKMSWFRDPNTGLIEQRLTDATAILPLDELMNFLGKGNYAIQKRIPFLTTIYSKEDHEKETKGDGPETLRNLAVSMLACSAPSWMREQVTQDIFGGGFMDRTLFIYRERTGRCYPVPPPLDPLQAEQLAAMLVPLTMMPVKQAAQLDYDARKWFDEWYRERHAKLAKSTEDPEATSLNRRSNHLLKNATLLAVSYGSFPTVALAHFEEAMGLLDVEDFWFVKFLKEVQRRPDSENYDYIRKVLKLGGGKMAASLLLQRIKNRLGPKSESWRYVETMLLDGTLLTEKDPKNPNVQWIVLAKPARELIDPEDRQGTV